LIAKSLLTLALLVLLSAPPALAQEVTAEIRTWSGQSLTLKDPTFEVFYTILPSVTAALGGPGLYAPTTPYGFPVPTPQAATGELAQPTPTIGVGSVGFQTGTAMQVAAGTLLPPGPASKQGRRQQEFLTVSRAGAEVHIPVSNLVSLAFTRLPVQGSPLPPYVAPTHFRHGVTAVLADGSQIDGDYVNMGTALLRGATPQGTVDIPWDELESVRFRR
jgi:hypothetical protein